MKQLRAGLSRLAGLFSGGRREQELTDEIESHLQMHIDDNLRAGMTPDQARRSALIKLGGLEPTKEAYRERRTVPFLDHLLRDIRFALRQLGKSPVFALTAIVMIALGICASVSIFAFVDAALIEPLPYRNPSRLVGVYEKEHAWPRSTLSYLDYLDWKKLNKVFRSLDAYQHSGFILNGPTGAQPTLGARVSAGFFQTLGIEPVLGRDFRAGEDLPAASGTVLLSYSGWKKRYGGRRDVLGRTITLNGLPHVVIGVLPPDFHFAPAEPAEFWTPLQASGPCEQNRSCHNLFSIARLKAGVTLETALAGMTLIAQQLERQYPGSNLGRGAALVPLSDVMVGEVRPILLVLLGGAGLLLLIACINVASLLLARSDSRKRETAIRGALGASGARLVQQFATEGLVLVAAGVLAGLIGAQWTIHLLGGLIPADMAAHMPFLLGIRLNLRVWAFAGAVSLLAALLFALIPLVRVRPLDPREGLADASRGSAGTTWRRFGSHLVVLELATATTLLVAAGLLGQSLYRLLHVDLGLQPDHLATLEVAASAATYGKDPQVVALARKIVTRIESLPGVKSVGIASQLPVSYNGNTDWIRFVGRAYHGEHNDVNERDVSSHYFATVQAKLLRGRYFTDAEDGSKPRVMIINQALAKQYFAGEDPIGKQVGDDGLSPKSIREIIGVVDDIREGALDSNIYPAEYLPFNQSPDTYFSILVRTSQGEEPLLPALAALIHQIDPGLATLPGATMNDRIHDSPSAYLHRSSAWLVGGFAGLALLLGALGLYGVIAYSVSQRTREIGVRMALGAQRSTVYRLVLNEAGRLIAVGIAAGLLCSLAAATLMRKLLFGIQSWDVPTLVAVAAVLAICALLASYLPARRAASVNPVDALRAE